MESSSSPTFLGLARELRDAIYDVLAEVEDLSSVMHTCRQLRKEILSRMPGSELVDYEQTYNDETLRRQFRGSIEVKDLFIIAEPWYSPGAALKFEVSWRKTRMNGDEPICESSWINTRRHPCEPASEPVWRTSRWTIRDLSSPMARYALFYCPRVISITFEAAISGYFQVALMILRAKVCDICQLMQDIRSKLDFRHDKWPQLVVHFKGGKDPTRHPLARKSFWEMRPKRFITPYRCVRCPAVHQSVCNRKSHRIRKFDLYPYFYECLALPLFYEEWVPCRVIFDLEPLTKRSSYFRQTHVATGGSRLEYFGADALFRELLPGRENSDGLLRYPYRHPNWYLSPGLEPELKTVTYRMAQLSLDADLLLGNPDCQEIKQLEDYVLGKRDAHARNPFAWSWRAFQSRCLTEYCQYQEGAMRASWENRVVMTAYIHWAEPSKRMWNGQPSHGWPSNEPWKLDMTWDGNTSLGWAYPSWI